MILQAHSVNYSSYFYMYDFFDHKWRLFPLVESITPLIEQRL